MKKFFIFLIAVFIISGCSQTTRKPETKLTLVNSFSNLKNAKWNGVKFGMIPLGMSVTRTINPGDDNLLLEFVGAEGTIFIVWPTIIIGKGEKLIFEITGELLVTSMPGTLSVEQLIFDGNETKIKLKQLIEIQDP